MAGFLEDREFTQIIKSTDWKNLFNEQPARQDFQEFKRVLRSYYGNEDVPSFEDFFAYCVKIKRPFQGIYRSFHQEFLDFNQNATSDAWQRFCTTFYRQPSFLDYANYISCRDGTNWSNYESQSPSFDTYLQFLIERDNVPFDWREVCGHMPSFLEYMVYLVGIAHVDWQSMGMDKPAFRQVMEQGTVKHNVDEPESPAAIPKDEEQFEQCDSSAKIEPSSPAEGPEFEACDTKDNMENVCMTEEAPIDGSTVQPEEKTSDEKNEQEEDQEELEEGEIEEGEIVDDPSSACEAVAAGSEGEKQDGPWCSQCGINYKHDTEKEHELRYHEPKTCVYRCALCGWDHASYALLTRHYSACHAHTQPPITRRARVHVPAIIVLPECKTCHYGSLIPFANSYHSCASLPRLRTAEGKLVVNKARECAHVEDGDPLCARCDSYFSPPLAQVSYKNGQFIIDIAPSAINPLEGAVTMDDSASDVEDDAAELMIDDNSDHEDKSSDFTALRDEYPVPLKERHISGDRLSYGSSKGEENQEMNFHHETDLQEQQDAEINNEVVESREMDSIELQSETVDMDALNESTIPPQEDTVAQGAGPELGSEIIQAHYQPVDEKRYSCKQCNYKTAVSSNLAHHRYVQHLIKDRVWRCRECGQDSMKLTHARKHYEKQHPGVAVPSDTRVMHVYAKPYLHPPRCDTCGYESCIAHALKYHQCSSRPVLRGTQLRIARPSLCPHTQGRGDLCHDCLRSFAPTERRVKYDCQNEQFVITVRERLVSEDAGDTDEEREDAGAGGSMSDSSEGERPDTSDESDEDAATRDLRERFFRQQSLSATGSRLHECRFCGKKKSKRTLIMHIKKQHCTKFSLMRCHLCGLDTVTYQDMRTHWRARHAIYHDFPPRAEVHFVSQPYQQIKKCNKCMYGSQIAYAVKLHSCDSLPEICDAELHIERALKCEHAQDVKYTYGLGAPQQVCADCVHAFIPDHAQVRYEAGVFKLKLPDQKLARDDPQYQAQQAEKDGGRNGEGGTTSNPLPGLTVNKRRLLNRSCTDLVTGIELRERYFCAAHAEEYASARAQVEHNHETHAKQPIMETYRCFVCSYDGQNFSNIKKHVLQYHKEDCIDNTLFIVKVSVPGYPKIPMCKHCRFASMDTELFRNHECYFWTRRSAVREDGLFRCADCGAGFRIEQHMWQHRVDEHTPRRYIYRCFVCGYDSESFTLIYKHIDEAHLAHRRRTILKEHCLISVEDKGRILKCRKCGYASLLTKCLKGHKCGTFPNKIFQTSIPRHEKPGRCKVPEKSYPKKSILGLNGLPPFPGTWKFRDFQNSADKSKILSSRTGKPRALPSALKQRGSKPSEKRTRVNRNDEARRDVHKRMRREAQTAPVSSRRHSRERRDSESSDSSLGAGTESLVASLPSVTEMTSQAEAHMVMGVPWGAQSGCDIAPHEADGRQPATMVTPTSDTQQSTAHVSSDISVSNSQREAKKGKKTRDNVSNYLLPSGQYPTAPPIAMLPMRYPTHPGDMSVYANGGLGLSYPGITTVPSSLPGSNLPSSVPSSAPAVLSAPSLAPESDTKCGHCCAMFATPQAKQEHVYDQHEQKTHVFRCSACSFDATAFAKLRKHSKQRHRGKAVNTDENEAKVTVPSFTYVPLCPRGCGYASLSPISMHRHRCTAL